MECSYAPRSQVLAWLRNGWRKIEGYPYRPNDWAVLLQAPEGWEAVRGETETLSLLFRDQKGRESRLCRPDGRPPFRAIRVTDRICTLPDCSRTHHGRGYCQMHYKRWKDHGHPRVIGKPGRKPKVAA